MSDFDVEMSAPSQDLLADQHYAEEDHRRMDQIVAETVGGWDPTRVTKGLYMVLIAVVDNDDRLVGLEVDTAKSLLRNNPEIMSKLEEAWKNQSYRDIRNLDILQISKPKSEPLSEAQLNTLQKGLTAPYKGAAVKAFYAYLEKNNNAFRDDHHYGKFCSIVQSSGTGKTRLLLELAMQGVSVLYMNIRSPDDKQGYPCRDNIPADILTNHCSTENEYRLQCYLFFAAVFKVLHEFKVSNWYEEMCKMESHVRTSFFVELEKEFVCLKKLNTSVSAALKMMQDNYHNLVALWNDNKDTPRVVIALDEAHVLYETNRQFHCASVLLRTIKEYSENQNHGVWVVFASTTSKVTHFSSPQALFRSARVSVHGQLLFPPFTYLGWDQNAPALEKVRPDQVANAEHIIRYGRPLWFSLKETFSLREIKLFAEQKLCGGAGFNVHNEHQVFAVLSQRFNLDVTFGHRQAVEFIATVVASHLRVCIKTTDDRLWSYTAYPSEPFLSCAAAALLHRRPSNLDISLSTLERMVNNGVVEIGQIGELVSRFIWLLAKDLLVRKDTMNTQIQSDQVLVDCQSIPVVEFLTFVFGSQIWENALEGQKTFQNAYINFSHWIEMNANINPSRRGTQGLGIDEWTKCHWQRTSAVQCCHGQPLVDKVIPMYFNDGTMSQIFISDKAGATQQHRKDLEIIERTHQSIAPDYKGSPYVTILVDLGWKTPSFEAWMDVKQEGNHCLRIYASGLDTSIYPFLADRPNIIRILGDLYKRQSPPGEASEPFGTLEAQVRFGWSNEPRHMKRDG